MSISASVVIPTHNRASKLGRLLDSLDRLEKAVPEEVIVVADRCTDGTNRLLTRWEKSNHQFQTKVITKQTSEGPGRTRNLGLLAAKGETVAFTDDDCVPESRWLYQLAERIDPDTGVVGVGGRVLPIRTDTISRYNTFWRILEPPASLEYLVSANCCYLRKEALRVGGFDEDITNPGGEDVGLGLKLRREGWRFDFAENATIYHDYRNNLVDFLRTFRNYGQGCHIAANRHMADHQGIPERTTTRTQPSFTRIGGYGYFGARYIEPGRLSQQILLDVNAIRQTHLLTPERVSFMALKILQRVAYFYGWKRA